MGVFYFDDAEQMKLAIGVYCFHDTSQIKVVMGD